MNAHMILKAALLVGFSLLVLTMMSPIETSQANNSTVGLAAPECPPEIDISKQEEGPDTREYDWGADVTFAITVTNTGSVDLINVAVTDPLVADCDRQIGPLAVGEFYPYTCEAPDATMDFTNIAAVQGEANGLTVYDEDPSSVTVKPCDPQIDIRKQEEGPDSRDFPWGADVPFEITVTNTGNVDLSNVVVTDSMIAACSQQIGPLAVGVDYPYTCEAPEVTVDFTNIAAVQGESNCRLVNDEDPSTVIVEPCDPQIDIRKQEEGPDWRSFEKGVDVPFEINVTNTGNVILSNVVVTDTEVVDCNRQIGTLAVGEDYSYTCEAPDVEKAFTNIAAARGESSCKIVYDEDPSDVGPPLPIKYDITIGFEDLKDNSDLDYNDWVVFIDTDYNYDLVDDDTVTLKKITFTIEPKARGAVLGHEFHIRFKRNTFKSDGVAELIIKDTSGNTIFDGLTPKEKNFDASKKNDFTIKFDDEHSCTCEAFSIHSSDTHNLRRTDENANAAYNTPAQRTAVLSITFDTPFDFDLPDYGQYCQGLFFDPYLHVLETTPYDISWTDKETENLILCVNDRNWQWSEESKQINLAYTRVKQLDLVKPPFFEFPPGWEACHNTCVFDGDKCDMRPCENVNSILYLPLMIRSQP